MKKSWIHKSIILNYIVPMSHIPIMLQTLLFNFLFISKVQTVFEKKIHELITKFSSLQQLYFGFYVKLRYFSVTFLNRNRTIFCDVTKIRWHGWWRDRTMCTSYDVLPLDHRDSPSLLAALLLTTWGKIILLFRGEKFRESEVSIENHTIWK